MAPVKTIDRRHLSKKKLNTHPAKIKIAQKGRLQDIAGCLSDEDAHELKSIIMETCEGIDRNEW